MNRLLDCTKYIRKMSFYTIKILNFFLFNSRTFHLCGRFVLKKLGFFFSNFLITMYSSVTFYLEYTFEF